jgi:hypothetical protein
MSLPRLIEQYTPVNVSKAFVKTFWMNETEIPTAQDCAVFTAHVQVVLWSEIKVELWSLLKSCALQGISVCRVSVSRRFSSKIYEYLVEKSYIVKLDELQERDPKYHATDTEKTDSKVNMSVFW